MRSPSTAGKSARGMHGIGYTGARNANSDNKDVDKIAGQVTYAKNDNGRCLRKPAPAVHEERRSSSTEFSRLYLQDYTAAPDARARLPRGPFRHRRAATTSASPQA